MIELIINNKSYSIKTQWAEFTFSEYAVLVRASGKSLQERLIIYTGIPGELVSKLTLAQVAFISDSLSFLDEPENAFIFAHKYEDDLNVGRKTYGEFEQALIFIRKAENQILSIPKVIECFYGEKLEDENVLKVLGKGAFVLDKISKFVHEFKRLGEYEPSVEELEAGVEELNKFGFFATAVQLARKYGKTHDDILNMPAREVYNTLLYDFEQSEVEKRINKIRSRKK